MLGRSSGPIYAVCAPTDMRRQHDGLTAIVRRALGHELTDGAMYLFANRRRTIAKVLYFDGSGVCLFCKKLSRGRFAAPWNDPGEACISLTSAELQLYLDGSHLVGRVALSPPRLTQRDLVIAQQVEYQEIRGPSQHSRSTAR